MIGGAGGFQGNTRVMYTLVLTHGYRRTCERTCVVKVVCIAVRWKGESGGSPVRAVDPFSNARAPGNSGLGAFWSLCPLLYNRTIKNF